MMPFKVRIAYVKGRRLMSVKVEEPLDGVFYHYGNQPMELLDGIGVDTRDALNHFMKINSDVMRLKDWQRWKIRLVSDEYSKGMVYWLICHSSCGVKV